MRSTSSRCRKKFTLTMLSFPTMVRPATLQGINLTVPPGPDGRGRRAQRLGQDDAVNLLPAFTSDSGRILIDGQDIGKSHAAQPARQAQLVTQNVVR